MPKLLYISGTYRQGGINDQIMDVAKAEASVLGWTFESVRLVDRKISYCKNCRACMQTPGEQCGQCVLQDDVSAILKNINECDALVLACPVNCYDITAVMRAFEERLVGCAYWKWGQWTPVFRNKKPRRPALLISTSAMPGYMARFFTHTMNSLGDIAQCLQSKPVERLYIGEIALSPDERISERIERQTRKALMRMLKEPSV